MPLISPLRPNMTFTDKQGNLTKEAFDFLQALFLRVGGSLSSLNAVTLENHSWESPGKIGNTTPSSGVFTNLQSGAFGCNGQSPQTPATVGAAVATTAATSSTPFGFTTAAQANDIVTKLNAVIAALKANGIIQ